MRRTRLRYGRGPSQFGELTFPERVERPAPAVVLFHGGTWRGLYSFRYMRSFARALAERGVATWNVEYRRVGLGGGHGGWPTTFEDSAAAVDFLVRLPEIDHARIATCGHSAGGHLALWAAGRHRLPEGAPGARPDQVVVGAVALAGVSDLQHLERFGLGHGAVDRLLGGTRAEVPERFALASPEALLPLGLPQLLIHGAVDRTVPAAMSESYVRRAVAFGDEASYLPLDGLGHRQLIERRYRVAALVGDFLDKLFA